MSLSDRLVSRVAIGGESKGDYPRKKPERMINDFPCQPWKRSSVILMIVVDEREVIGRPIFVSGEKVKKGVDEETLSIGLGHVLREGMELRKSLMRE